MEQEDEDLFASIEEVVLVPELPTIATAPTRSLGSIWSVFWVLSLVIGVLAFVMVWLPSCASTRFRAHVSGTAK